MNPNPSLCARSLRVGGLLFLIGIAGMSSVPAFAADAASVSGADATQSANGQTSVRIHLAVIGATPTFSAFRASNPDRLMIDIAGASVIDGAAAPAGGIVSRSEFSKFNDGTDNVRLTLYLTGPATHEVRAEGTDVVITLSPGAVSDPLAAALGTPGTAVGTLSGPSTGVSGPALVTLDFENRETSSRVLLGIQDSEPAVSQPEKTLIVIDLPRATLPSSLSRDLDTSRFYSGVQSVNARPTRSGSRVEIRLREAAEYSVSRDHGLFVLDIKTPADILAARDASLQKAATAAPATPATNGGEGLSNAQNKEIIIGDKGRTSDPNQTYGAGNGSDAPDSLSFATDAPGSSNAHYQGRRMSIDLQDADIHTVFRFIADTADLNIIASDDVKGTVTVRLKDVPWDQALASILQAKGYAAQRFGNIVRVAPIETIKAEQQAQLETQRTIADLEPLMIYVAPMNYASGAELLDKVKAMLSARGSVQVDERGNQLIIKDVSASIAQVRELLKHLDKQNRQVSIEARFVEANSSWKNALGIQWGSSVDASAATGYPTGAFFPNSIGASGGITQSHGSTFYQQGADSLLVDLPAAGQAGSLAFSLGSIPGLIDLDARLSALEQEGWGRIISSPRVTALDNEEARVKQGSKVPFLSVSNSGTQVQFINAALELTVTPHITSDDTVFMKIEIKNNRPDFGQAVQGQPAILIKEVESKVLVMDGDTAVLGGVYATAESFAQSRVPGLGSIPIIGLLFKNTLRDKSQNEMLVFITPHIVPEND